MHHPTPGHVPRDVPVKEKTNGAVEVRGGSLLDLRVERVPTVLGRVQLVGEEDRPGPRCPCPPDPVVWTLTASRYLRVFDAVPFASYGQRRCHGAVQEYRHPGFQDSDLYTETLGQGDQFLGALGPSEDRGSRGRSAHLLDIEAVCLGQPDRNFLNPQDMLKQAFGELADVAPDLLDCETRRRSPQASPAAPIAACPRERACAGARRSGLPHRRS